MAELRQGLGFCPHIQLPSEFGCRVPQLPQFSSGLGVGLPWGEASSTGTSLCPREPALVVVTYSGSYGKERAPNKRRQDSNSIGIWDQVYATLEVADGIPRGYSRGRKKRGRNRQVRRRNRKEMGKKRHTAEGWSRKRSRDSCATGHGIAVRKPTSEQRGLS